jgi:integrative and conjugative element protein (TIGR02256 family)
MRYTSHKAQTFLNVRGNKFKLSHAALAQMIGYVQNEPNKREAGGVLLGRYILDCEDVIVDRITMPTKRDQRSRFRFFRSARLHQQAIDKAWTSSEGTCNYLGEWHTHPEPDPSPSFIDMLGWRKKLLFDKFDSDVLYFVIVGTEQINAWQGHRRTLSIEKLHKAT